MILPVSLRTGSRAAKLRGMRLVAESHAGAFGCRPIRCQEKRYWLPNGGTTLGEAGGRSAGLPDLASGPLKLRETAPRRFKSPLSPDAFFLRDHVISGVPTLPGVVYLELMRRAVEAAGRDGTLGQVVWLKPLHVTQPMEIEVVIGRGSESRPRIEVVRIEADGVRHVHAEARLFPLSETRRTARSGRCR